MHTYSTPEYLRSVMFRIAGIFKNHSLSMMKTSRESMLSLGYFLPVRYELFFHLLAMLRTTFFHSFSVCPQNGTSHIKGSYCFGMLASIAYLPSL